MTGCINFQQQALVHHTSQVDHKSLAKVLLQQHLKATSDNLSLCFQTNKKDDKAQVTVIWQSLFLITTTKRISQGRVTKILAPTQNAWDPNLTGHVGLRTQIEKSQCHSCCLFTFYPQKFSTHGRQDTLSFGFQTPMRATCLKF